MSALPGCPKCHSELTCEDGGGLYIDPECGNESPVPAADAVKDEGAKL